MQYFNVGNQFITQIIVPESEAAPVPVNHIWCYDRSGSMHHDLPELATHLCARISQMAVGDTLTIGWFSGEGRYDFILKGYKITSIQDYSVLSDIIQKNKTSIGLTCFSEIIGGIKPILDNLNSYSNNFALNFFTDGYPVVSNYSSEVKSVMKNLEEISGYISSALLVGYGNYYNKDLMAAMAEKLGGSLVHSSKLFSYSDILSQFINSAQGMKQHVLDLPVIQDEIVFTIRSGLVTRLTPNNRQVRANAGETVYIVSQNKPTAGDPSPVDQTAGYALAYLYAQSNRIDAAIEVLGELGDVNLIDTLYNSFTLQEIGEAEGAVLQAVNDQKKRYLRGKNSKYLPKPDAFNLVQLFELLSENEVFFHPHNKIYPFVYNRIGVASKPVDGYPTFVPDGLPIPLSNLVWNETKLNLSMLVSIPGTIKLMEKEGLSPSKLGLAENYPTRIWRAYTIIKDGMVNTKMLPLSMNKAVHTILFKNGLIQDAAYEGGKVYAVRLDGVPVVNRQMAQDNRSAIALADQSLRELHLKAKIKVLKSYIDAFTPEAATPTSLGEKVEALLTANGVSLRDMSFSPPSQKVDAEDYYLAKTFEIKVAGCSSLPAVKKVLGKLESGKSLTASEALIGDHISPYKGMDVESLQGELAKAKTELNTVRNAINRTKFCLLLGKSWFEEFKSREENSVDYKGYKITFVVGETKEKY